MPEKPDKFTKVDRNKRTLLARGPVHGVTVDRPRRTNPFVHDPGGIPTTIDDGGTAGNNGPLGSIPTTADIAQSFLQAESVQERAKLEAAISRPQLSQQSQSSEEGEDDDLSTGIGAGYSLPSFIAGFLKGVGDRLRLEVRGVQLDLDFKLEALSTNPTVASSLNGSETLTLRTTIDTIIVNEVVYEPGTSTEEDHDGNHRTTIENHGVRRISFVNVQVMLVSEASLFDFVSHFSGPPSPTATHSSHHYRESSKSSQNATNTKSQSSSSGHSIDLTKSIVLDSVQQHYSIPGLTASDGTSDGKSRITQTKSSDVAPLTGIEQSIAELRSEDSDFHFPCNSESPSMSQIHDASISRNIADSDTLPKETFYTSFDAPSEASKHRRVQSEQSCSKYTRNVQSPHTPYNTGKNVFASIPYFPDDLSSGDEQTDAHSWQSFERNRKRPHSMSPGMAEIIGRPPFHSDDCSHERSRGASSTSASDEDLTQSRIFSHEEANSVYMSAISQTFARSSTEDQRSSSWDASSADTEAPYSNIGDNGDTLHDSSGSVHVATEMMSVGVGHTIALDRSRNKVSSSVLSHDNNPQRTSSGVATIADELLAKPSRADSEAEIEAEPEARKSSKSASFSSMSGSSNRVMKRLLHVHLVEMSLPQISSEYSPPGSDDQNTANPKSQGPYRSGLPGTFSTFDLSQSSPSGPTQSWTAERPPNSEPGHQVHKPISVSVQQVAVMADMGLIRLLVIITQQFSALHNEAPDTSPLPGNTAQISLPISFHIDRISLSFVTAVRACNADAIGFLSSSRAYQSDLADTEVLLTLIISNLGILHSYKSLNYYTEISIGRFTFGHPSESIISFDSSLRIRDSTRDILAPVDKDVVVNIVKTPTLLKIDATTLPLHIKLNLARLDETFTWFGGLSTVLGLGNSMASTVTTLETKTKPGPSVKRSRGVRFDTPGQQTKSSTTSSAQQKITLRIGGLLFDLQGKDCSLRLESTAIKLVSRDEGIGMTIDKLKFGGPYLHNLVEEPAAVIHCATIRVEYLPNPKEVDLARLLALLSPSRDRDEPDDDILLETLFRQRRQGGVLRFTVGSVDGDISRLHDFEYLSGVAEELGKLSTVAKYLPEDDRPGILSLILIRKLCLTVDVNKNFGSVTINSTGMEVAHVTLPSLVLLGINLIQVHRQAEVLVAEGVPLQADSEQPSPMIMARFVGDEMEPTLKFKLWNVRIEYHVSTIMAMLGIAETTSGEVILADIVSSVAILKSAGPPPKLSSHRTGSSMSYTTGSKSLKLEVSLRDSVIGLNPRNSQAKGLLVFSNATILSTLPKDDESEFSGIFEVRRASVMVVDDVVNIAHVIESQEHELQQSQRAQVQALVAMGYVAVSDISAARISWQMAPSGTDDGKSIDVEIRDDLFVLETCADSTQTLQTVLNGLQPPMPSNKDIKYRTEVVPVEDMLASFTGNDFSTRGDDRNQSSDDQPLGLDEGDLMEDDVPQNLEFVSSFYNPNPEAMDEDIANSILERDLDSLAGPPLTREIGDKPVLQNFQEQYEIAPGNESLNFTENHFGSDSKVGGTAHRWDSDRNTYDLATGFKIRGSPLRLRVRDVHIIWNLFDGYDWQHTRDVVSQAVADVETRAAEKMARRDKRKTPEPDDGEEAVIGDFLFNSIYIGVSPKDDPRDLRRQINRNLDDLTSEAESYATSTTVQGSPVRQDRMPRPKKKRLRLGRSKHHKMTFELRGVCVDLVVFPPRSGETQSSIDIRIQDFEIFDHVPTSTWKKFATYMHDAGERQSGSNMVHVEILNVKPILDLAASEIILKATVLPLRLHVDQDALDFVTRFFEFKNDSAPIHPSKSDIPFLQRVEVNSVQIKLDFKPKRVDYAGLRSGHTTEFMNFFILDQAFMVLRHVIIYGVSGFDKLGKTLNDIWMPDIKRNQLPGILAGLAPVRSLVNVGGSMKDLVLIPMREYRKDGRVIRSIQKGAFSFAKTTTTELAKLGAKLAIGTQTVLQGAEDYLVQSAPSPQRLDNWEDTSLDEDEKKHISLYADQPVGVMQGLRGAYRHLERDLLLAKDAIVAMPGEVMESGSAGGAARAVMRGAPTVILRPALGVTKAVGQTLLGATNSLDKAERRRTEDVNIPLLFKNFIWATWLTLFKEIQAGLLITRMNVDIVAPWLGHWGLIFEVSSRCILASIEWTSIGPWKQSGHTTKDAYYGIDIHES